VNPEERLAAIVRALESVGLSCLIMECVAGTIAVGTAPTRRRSALLRQRGQNSPPAQVLRSPLKEAERKGAAARGNHAGPLVTREASRFFQG
jgi:hypothetical protein